jgi:hypothetical protein
MKKILLPLTRIITFSLPLTLLASCGGSGTSALPGNTIEMHVTTTTWNIDFGAPATFQNEPVLISLKTPTGYQLGASDLHVLLDLSPGSYTGAPPMRIFEETSPGNNDFTKELIPMPYTTQTDPSGNKVLQLNMQLGNGGNGSYKGILYIYSGSTVGTASFEVKCVPPPGVTPAPC